MIEFWIVANYTYWKEVVKGCRDILGDEEISFSNGGKEKGKLGKSEEKL